jgi:hypothetical protein
MAVALLGTVAAVALADRTDPSAPSVLFQIALASVLGIPFLAGLALTAEKRTWGKSVAWGTQLLGLLILALYGWSLPMSLFRGPEIHMDRFLLLLIAALAFLSTGPFVRKGELNGFWQYNKALLFRLIITGVYSAVLFAGLAIALAALNILFGVHVPPQRYAQLWILIVGLFGTSFFLAGVPESLSSLDQERAYPKGLRVFAQYILLPLLSIYLIILYAYLFKIVAQWNWPKGWVSGLILGFTATGISAFLLVYPIRDLAENRWMRTAWRWFFLIIIPLIVVLFLAASQRISQYGITEGRYFLLTCGVWLALLALYFNLSGARSIKFIPISIGLIVLVISFGPWGAFAVSQRSQVARLEKLITRNEILVDGKIQKAASRVPDADAREISAILIYLEKNHGYAAIQPWFAQSLQQSPNDPDSHSLPAETVTGYMGVKYFPLWVQQGYHWFNYGIEPGHVVEISPYQHVMLQRALPGQDSVTIAPGLQARYSANGTSDTVKLVVVENGQRVDSAQTDLRQLVTALRNDHPGGGQFTFPPDSLSARASSDGVSMMVLISYLNGQLDKDSVTTLSGTVDIFFSINRPQK